MVRVIEGGSRGGVKRGTENELDAMNEWLRGQGSGD